MGRRRRRGLAVSVVGLVGGLVACTFSSRIGGDGGTDGTDAPPTVCGGMTCNWGCIENRCAIVVPAGGGATPTDTKPESLAALADIVLPAGTTIDGTAGTITGITAGFTFEPRGTIAVFRMKSLTINGQVKLAGSAAIAIVTDGPIAVNAVVEAKGPCGSNDSATLPGPGGFAGGLAAGANAVGPGSGAGAVSKAGAGGGGNGTRGGSGGTGAAAGGAGGAIAGTPTIDMLFGGGGGGGTDGAGGRGRGGGGGGAVQLVSNTKITIASGGIDAGGCGGDSGQGMGEDGGGGGGAGGTILLEAPIIDGAGGRLAVNGGGGGGGDAGTPTGAKSMLNRSQAAGANSTANGAGGGSGAAGAAPAVKGDDDTTTHAGGGGGGIGRIRFNTRDGTVAFTGVSSPAVDDPASTCTAGTASTQ